jgi:hypothetical protein
MRRWRLGSPIKSLTLIQGAFSHFAFASALPFDPRRKGSLSGVERRVDGPILATFSAKDTAVGKLYPAASRLSHDDAAAVPGAADRWGAIGSNGTQAVSASVIRFGDVGTAYAFGKGMFVNLDGNELIVRGGPPSGAHSDIVYPQIAWALLAAAGLSSRTL